MRPVACLVLAVLIFATVVPPAAAQHPDTTLHEPAYATKDAERKSPVRAGLYSLAGTVGPMAAGLVLMRVGDWSRSAGRVEVSTEFEQFGAILLLGGLVAGPAAGHVYVDDHGHAYTGLWIRGGAAAVGVGAATVIVLDATGSLLALESPALSRTGRIAEDVLMGAVLVMVGSALVDIVTAPLSAREYNETTRLRVGVVPHIHPSLDRAGLSVRLRF